MRITHSFFIKKIKYLGGKEMKKRVISIFLCVAMTAALDVYWDEPLDPDDSILKLDNITLTPHNAGSVVDALPKSPWLLVKTVNKYWEDKKSDMVVNKVEYPW